MGGGSPEGGREGDKRHQEHLRVTKRGRGCPPKRRRLGPGDDGGGMRKCPR